MQYSLARVVPSPGVQYRLSEQLPVALAEGHQLAGHEHPGLVQVTSTIGVRQVPDLGDNMEYNG